MKSYFKINNVEVRQVRDKIGRVRQLWVVLDEQGREHARGKDFPALCEKAARIAVVYCRVYSQQQR